MRKRDSLADWVREPRPTKCATCKHGKAKAWCAAAFEAMQEAGVRVSYPRMLQRLADDTGIKIADGALRTHMLEHVEGWRQFAESTHCG